MKIVLNLKNEPKENDIIVFKNGEWTCVPFSVMIQQLTNQVKSNQLTCRNIEEVFLKFKNNVNDKLSEHHEVLKILTKEN